MYKLKNCNLLNKSSRDLNWVATRIETHTAHFTLLLLTALAKCKPKPKSFYFADAKGNLTAVGEVAKMIIHRLIECVSASSKGNYQTTVRLFADEEPASRAATSCLGLFP